MVRLLLLTALAAQEPRDPHEVRPERPTVATHAYTVAPGYLEAEVGVERDRLAPGQAGVTVANFFKLGAGTRVQANVSLPLVRGPGGELGVGDVAIGFKWHLLDAAPVLADFALVPGFKTNTGSESLGRGTGTNDLSLWLVSSRRLGPIGLDLNVGASRRLRRGAASTTATVWTISTGGPFAGPAGWVLELYGYPGTSGPAGQAPITAVLFGPTWSVRPWLVFDAGVIAPLSGLQPRALYAGSVVNVGRLWHAPRAAGFTGLSSRSP